MSQEAERVYTINLGKVWLSPDNQRAKRAINMIKEFAEHHMKTEQIKIDQELSQQVWKRGIRSPPRKIRVKMAKTEDGYVMVSPYEEESAKPKAEEKPKKSDKKSESKEEPAAKPEAKAEKPEPKAEKTAPKEKKADAKKPAAKKSSKKSK
ncbi:50S ribosomal protein L31e [Candidatus Nitrosotenuis chungbukensis]|uniref:50S ribosomal protein L31e n=2 Tax=Candidatus Nitrosotenuis chungbukensis TaxID=1353246 RepID=UPI0005B2B2D1|nr:50S ribosomal protein L31e [Candidatus Nitrosotenuis chungbukensis]